MRDKLETPDVRATPEQLEDRVTRESKVRPVQLAVVVSRESKVRLGQLDRQDSEARMARPVRRD